MGTLSGIPCMCYIVLNNFFQQCINRTGFEGIPQCLVTAKALLMCVATVMVSADCMYAQNCSSARSLLSLS